MEKVANKAQIRVHVRISPNAAEYLTAEELDAVRRVEGQISVLIEAGMQYGDIRDVVLRGRG